MDFPIISPLLGVTVSIRVGNDRLRIVDPRPTSDIAITAAVLVVALVLVFSDLLYLPIWSPILGGVAFVYFLYRCATRPFRDVYIIDKAANQYHLHRQSFFKTRTDVGDTRQISAVQVEHIETRQGTSRTSHYRVVFLMKMELLFGMPPTQPIREFPLLFSHPKTEARIGEAMAAYLGVRFDNNVDKATF